MAIKELISLYGDKYLESLLMTWRLTGISFPGALAIGVVITVMRVCPIRPLRLFGDFYVQLFRNIPGAAMLIIVTFALPYAGIMISDYFDCVLICTTLIPSAFCSEHLMSGINTVSKGEIEAARALGLSFFKLIRKIVIPQALRSAVLPMTNLLVATMLTTSLASQVPVRPRDLTAIVQYISRKNASGVTAFVISAVLYCLSALIIGRIGAFIDRKVRISR